MTSEAKCQLCGEPMPPGEEMFNYHGYSGPCPVPETKKPNEPIKPADQDRLKAGEAMTPADLIARARELAGDLQPIPFYVPMGPWARLTNSACDALTDLADALEAALKERDDALAALEAKGKSK